MSRIRFHLLLLAGAVTWTRAFWLAATDRRAATGAIAIGALLFLTSRLLQVLERATSAPSLGSALPAPATKVAIAGLMAVVAALLNFGIALFVASTDATSAFQFGMFGALLLQVAVLVEVDARERARGHQANRGAA